MKKLKFRAKTLLTVLCIFCTAVIGTVVYAGYSSTRRFDTSQDFVKVIDVGQADCIFIYSNGCSALIDTGLASSTGAVFDALDSAGVTDLDVLLLTHLHDDHTGGTDDIAGKYGIDNLILPSYDSTKDSYREISENVYAAKQGMYFNIGEFEITLLASYGDMPDENDRSVFVMAESSGKKFLFTGDAGEKAEERLIDERINIDCDVLKVGHHGSGTSSSKEFLSAATPEYAAVSVGKNNSYSHPAPETLSELKDCGAELLRTDKNGDITFHVEEGKIRTETEK